MRHFIALLVKAVFITVIFFTILNFLNEYPALETTILAIITIGALYIVGDLFILRVTNNIIATLADVGLCFFIVLVVGSLLYGVAVPFATALFVSFFVGVGELFFHLFIGSEVLVKHKGIGED